MISPRRFALLITAIAGLSGRTFSQELVDFQMIEASCDTLHAQVSVFFPFGAGNTCPPLSGYAVLPGDATAFISLYYDISGPWPELGCTTTTTIAIPIPDGDVMVALGTFNIMDGDTSDLVSDTLFNVCMLGIADDLLNLPGFWLESDQLHWLPVRDRSSAQVQILSSSGHRVRTCSRGAGTCWLGDLAPGIYTAWWPGGNGAAVFRFARP